MQGSFRRRCAELSAFALLALAGLLAAAAAVAQMTVPDVPPTVRVPEDTGAGVWDGTYVYSSRDWKMAVWIRTRDGVPEVKLRYLSLQTPESFETDWSSRSTYFMSGQPAKFEISFAHRDARHMQGAWHWVAENEGIERTEDGTFAAFRSGYGRAMVIKFNKLERQYRRGTDVRVLASTPVWTLLKVSKRSDTLWEELPF